MLSKQKMRSLVVTMWALVLGLIAYVAFSFNFDFEAILAQAKGNLQALGVVGAIIFLLSATVRPIFLLPASAFTITAVTVYGYTGILIAYFGEVAAASLCFLLSRYIGHEFIENHAGDRFKKFEHRMENHSFKSILLLRMMFFVPNDLISYAAGASNIGFLVFVLATAAGIAPMISVYGFTLMGFGDLRYLVVPGIILTILTLASKFIRYEYEKHKQKSLSLSPENCYNEEAN